MQIREECMSEEFMKYHVDGLPRDVVFHKFSPQDKPAQIHDHPWGFTTFIIKGGYVERVYEVAQDGSWTSRLEHRKPGTSHYVAATHIHELVKFPEGECWTLILPEPCERVSRVWEFTSDGAFSKEWHEEQFTPYKQAA